ncbi:MAG: universal stress protein [Nitriliruptor sp.]|nr:MAG: universal stress protein [Nitriliruptor sp.]
MATELRTSTASGAMLVGVDTSTCSRLALQWAAGAARHLGVPLHVVEAWQYPSDTVVRIGRVELPDPAHADAMLNKHLTQLVAETIGDAPDLDVTVEVIRGPTSSALLNLAAGHASMVVVGSRGMGGFRGLRLGSVSRQLCEHAPCPVTVVRHLPRDGQIRLDTIAVGVDGSAHATRALVQAAYLAERTGARIIAVHAAAPGGIPDASVQPLATSGRSLPDLLEEWCAPLHTRGLEEHESVVAEGDARTALLDVAEERGADLVVVGSRGLGPVSKLVLGSVASSLIQHSQIPVMVVPRAPEH